MDMDRQAQAVSEPIAYVVTLLDGLRKVRQAIFLK